MNSFLSPYKQHFDKTLLPNPLEYYSRELGPLRGRGKWMSVKCIFHEDAHPSLNVNIITGQFRCHACGARGGDILAFQMQHYNQDFITAAKHLGAWDEEGFYES